MAETSEGLITGIRSAQLTGAWTEAAHEAAHVLGAQLAIAASTPVAAHTAPAVSTRICKPNPC